MFEVNHPNFKSMLDILGKLKFSHIKEKGLERCERVTKSQRFTKTKKFLETIGTRESKTVIFSHFFLPPHKCSYREYTETQRHPGQTSK